MVIHINFALLLYYYYRYYKYIYNDNSDSVCIHIFFIFLINFLWYNLLLDLIGIFFFMGRVWEYYM